MPRLTSAFCYILERIQKRLSPNLVVIHRHFSGTSQRNFLDSSLRTLQGESYPNYSSSVKIIYQTFIQNIVILEPKLAEFICEFKTQVNQIQTNLETEDLIEYQNKIIKPKKRIPGVIGGHHIKIKVIKKYFLKKVGQNHGLNEVFGYFQLHRRFPKLVPFLSRCFGVLFVSPDFEFSPEVLDSIIPKGKVQFPQGSFYPLER